MLFSLLANEDFQCGKRPLGDTRSIPLNSDDIYKELRLRGYDYGPAFRGVLSADGTGTFQLSSCVVLNFFVVLLSQLFFFDC